MRTLPKSPVVVGLLGFACLLAATATPAPSADARSSAAHTRLVFASQGRLWAVSPRGGNLHCFARVPENTIDISASDSGRRIAVITNKGVPFPGKGSIRKIYLWRKGHDLKLLLRLHTIADTSVAISADGRRIAYGKDNEIWMMRADGSHREALTGGDVRRAFDPAFAPSGKNLFFVRNSMNAGTNRISRKPFTTPYHSEIGLTPPGADDHSPVVSVRHKVAFVQLGEGARGGTPDRIRVMDPNGHNPRTVPRSNDPRFNLDPDFSPNGRAIAFMRLREVNHDHSPRRYSIRTIRTSGKNEKVVVRHLSARPRGLQWTRIP